MSEIKVPWTRPFFAEEEKEAINRIYDSGFLSQGKEVAAFEEEIAKYLGAKHAVVVSSGTMALLLPFLHIRSIYSGKNNVVHVSGSTFSATLNIPMFLDLKVNPVDINPKTSVWDVLPPAQEGKVNLFLPVHLMGNAVQITDEDRQKEIIEDGCQAFGSVAEDGFVGSKSEYCAFSFHIAKIITTVEGGCITTNSESVKNYLKELRNHGMTRDYYIDKFGMNGRSTDLHAAIGRIQLRRIEKFIQYRLDLKKIYDERLGKFPEEIQLFETPSTMKRAVPGLYAIKVKNAVKLRDFLSRKGIDSRLFFPPLDLQIKYCRGYEINSSLPDANMLYISSLLLPMGNAITEAEVNYTCDKILEFIKQ